MSTIGQSRGGIVNTTETPTYNVPGFSNVTPTYTSQLPQQRTIDIDDMSLSGVNDEIYHSKHNHHTIQKLENIVDRIVNRAGPPKSSLGNPGPLGLAAFAATTFVLSTYNAGLLVSTTENVVLPIAFWYGGIVQVLAGLWEYAANNTFGATAFCSYGAFWLSFATLSEFWAPTGYASTQDINSAVGIYLLPWTIFTAYMFLGSLRMSGSLVAVFGLLEITFALLTAGHFALNPSDATNLIKAGGWFGIFTAFAAWYASAAVVINGTFGAQLLPVGVLGPLHPNMTYLPKVVKRKLTTSNLGAAAPVSPQNGSDNETEHNTPSVGIKRV